MTHAFRHVALFGKPRSDGIREPLLAIARIVEATGATQTNVSRHLALMHQAGVVTRRREGTTVYYKVTDPEFVEICRTVCVRIAGRIEAGLPLKHDLLEFAAQH